MFRHTKTFVTSAVIKVFSSLAALEQLISFIIVFCLHSILLRTEPFRAAQTKTEFIKSKVGDLLDPLLGDFSEPTMSHPVERLH